MNRKMPDKDEALQAIRNYREHEDRDWINHAKTIISLKYSFRHLSIHKKIGDLIMSDSFPEKDQDLLKKEGFSIINKIEILYMEIVNNCEYRLNDREGVNDDGGDPLREIEILLRFASDLHQIIFSSTEQDGVFDEWIRRRDTLIGHNSKKKEKAKEFWKPWQERFRQLRNEGFGPYQARDQILSEMGDAKVTLKSLKTWLRD